ncbi:hypothetical protein [Vibrio mediterranei]|uniref:hypothetical protein n=1 Tax=Vibrio mediterranei TaxID=689 RepID=UPI0015521BEA|nr:hypothetical protein [Vibrio mediterranei]
MTEPCMSNDTGHYQGLYSERKECGVIGAYPSAKASENIATGRLVYRFGKGEQI